ncbi:MAG: hypothetical protein RQ847_09000 [Wenzhouxiangellaceae bacterium]|nr:hypothetical protein [Wenzhouxiangellaceae bacterium]
MVKQLLVTVAVALVVVMIARMKRGKESAGRSDSGSADDRPVSTTALAGYALAAVMIVTAGTLTWMGWKERNEIIEVVVIDARTGERTVYSVRRKALGERQFRTVDGRIVSLGSADRMERVE